MASVLRGRGFCGGFIVVVVLGLGVPSVGVYKSSAEMRKKAMMGRNLYVLRSLVNSAVLRILCKWSASERGTRLRKKSRRSVSLATLSQSCMEEARCL